MVERNHTGDVNRGKEHLGRLQRRRREKHAGGHRAARPAIKADLAGEEEIASPEGAIKETGSVGESGHMKELAVVAIGKDILGLVDDKEKGGSIAHDVGIGILREEGDAGTPQMTGEGTVLAPAPTGEALVVEEVIKALDGLKVWRR